MAVKISGVDQGSPAWKAGIRQGEILISINGQSISDVLDYRFYMTERRLVLKLQGGNGPRILKVQKKEYDDLGLLFDTYLMDRQRSCKNHCVFCFIDQNPKGMRESIYFKDDDDRLSFLFGNYITLTNLSDHDIDRIIKMKISPINISVHTTNPELRVRMMRNPNAGPSLARLKKLADAGVAVNTQLVLCPGLNDGEELEKTLCDLEKLYPSVQSIACVPVGLTGYREGLYELRPFTKEEAARTVAIIEAFSGRRLREIGERVAYPADEFFLKAELPIPPAEYYGEFQQLENGVGLLSLLESEFRSALKEAKPLGRPRSLTIGTGEASYPTISRLCKEAEALDSGLRANVVPIENRFFGGYITVTGLVTGSDVAAKLAGKKLGERVILPLVMLRHEQDLFLDDMTVDGLSSELGVPVSMIPADGESLVSALLEEDKR